MPAKSATAPEQSLNKSGQSMRSKGQDKYQRLVQATASILATHSLSSLKAADIARAAGTSAPNFYLYFSNVLDAVLAAVQQVSMASPQVLAMLQEPWPDAQLDAKACAFVQAYVAHCQGQAPLVRVRSVLVAEGDKRFRDAEMAASTQVLLALSAKFDPDERMPEGMQVTRATSTAGVMLAMLDRLVPYLPYIVAEEGEGSPSMASLIEAAAHTLALGIRDVRAGARSA